MKYKLVLIFSSNIISIVETAKANNLVVERDIVYLFDNISKIDVPIEKLLRIL